MATASASPPQQQHSPHSTSPHQQPYQRPLPSPAPSSSSLASQASGKSKQNLKPNDGLQTNPLGPDGGKVTPQVSSTSEAGDQAILKKPGMATRLSRMFSSKNVNDNSRRASNPSPNGTDSGSDRPNMVSRQSSISGRSRASSNALKAQPNGAAGAAGAAGATGAVNAVAAAADRVGSISETAKEHMKDKDAHPQPHPVHGRRFVILEDGNHEHNLKSDKRQEKLSDLFTRMLIGRKKESENPNNEHQLSLMSSWVDQVKSEKDKLANDKQGGPNAAGTLVEKYGKCQEVVGRGAFGIVRISHKADSKDPKKEQLYAIKEFRRRPSESPKKYNKRLTSEFCISSALRHPNVIHTLDLMKDAKGDFCEVMEFCAGGDLYTLVLAAGKLEVVEADCYFKQLMRGVEYIHEMGVAHRDLKPENLLLTSHGGLKITDFGNGECFRMAWEKEPHMVGGLCGSAPYIAPEEYIDSEFDPRAVDVWACGVIYMAMRTGRHLWRVARKDEDEFYERYLEGRRDEDGYAPIETLHRARCRNVIYSILDPNPTRRITATQVLKSEWGREIKLCKAGEEGY